MRVIACQLDIAWEDKGANHQRVRRLLDGVDVPADALIVLPEMFATGYSMNVRAIREGDAPDDQPTQRFCAELARERSAYVLAGVVREDAGESRRGRNDAIVIDPAGREVARYTKMHPMTVGGEADHYVPGAGVVTFDVDTMRVSPFICYDLRFPEIFREAAARGAHVMPVIANWPAVRQTHWRALLIARAIENQAYVIGVNRTGDSPQIQYVGGSIIIDPRGEVIAEAGPDQTVLTADLDLAALLEYREKFPALQDRRA